MTNQDNNDLEKIQNKLDIKQFSEYQIAISKQLLHDEFEKTRKELNSYKIKFWVTIAAIVGVTGVGSLFTWNKIIKDLNTKVSNRLDIEVNRIDTTIQKRLNYEFSTPRITKLVADKAQDYTEKNAKNYIETQVANKIEPFINQTKIILNKSETQLTIVTLHTRAMADSKSAFDKLKILSKGNGETATAASDAVKTIIKSLQYFEEDPGFSVTDDNFTKATAEERIKMLEDPKILSGYKRYYIYDFGPLDRNSLLHFKNILSHSESLQLCAIACAILKNKYSNKADFMDFEGWIKIIESDLR